MSNNAKLIITAYLKNGGSSMSEEDYQKYKFAMLSNFLTSENRMGALRKITIKKGKDTIECLDQIEETHFMCKLPCMFETTNVDEAITHLGEHYPQYFALGNGRK